MSRRINWDAARQNLPDLDRVDWQQELLANPDALYRIIADAYDLILRDKERSEGLVRIGRRPRPSVVPVDEVIESVFPAQYSNDPFPEALREVMGEQTQRAFSEKVPINQGTLSRLLSGRLVPDLEMLERVAAAGGVPPWYFREWRAEYVAALVREVLSADPSMSVRAVRALRERARSWSRS